MPRCATAFHSILSLTIRTLFFCRQLPGTPDINRVFFAAVRRSLCLCKVEVCRHYSVIIYGLSASCHHRLCYHHMTSIVGLGYIGLLSSYTSLTSCLGASAVGSSVVGCRRLVTPLPVRPLPYLADTLSFSRSFSPLR